MHLHIHSIEKTIYDGEADIVILPTETGEISVLPNHTPLVSALKKGVVIAKSKTSDQKFAVTGGFAQINSDSVIILVD